MDRGYVRERAGLGDREVQPAFGEQIEDPAQAGGGEEGNRRWTALRGGDLDGRFPGLLDAIVTAYENGPAPVRSGG